MNNINRICFWLMKMGRWFKSGYLMESIDRQGECHYQSIENFIFSQIESSRKKYL